MRRNLERRVERLEQAVGIGSDDPRVDTYPTCVAELSVMAIMSEEELQKYLRTRRTKPTLEICDRFDQLFEAMRLGR